MTRNPVEMQRSADFPQQRVCDEPVYPECLVEARPVLGGDGRAKGRGKKKGSFLVKIFGG